MDLVGGRKVDWGSIGGWKMVEFGTIDEGYWQMVESGQ